MTTPDEENLLVEFAFNDVRRVKPICHDAQTLAYVEKVVRRTIGANSFGGLQCQVEVFDDGEIDAFALPGGRIGIHKGILPLAENEAGLAAVLDEVIAHVTQRHGGQRYAELSPSLLGGLTLTAILSNVQTNPDSVRTTMAIYGLGNEVGVPLPYSAAHLEDADRLCLTWMARAGYDPHEALSLWKRLIDYSKSHKERQPEFLKIHPCDENRLQQMESFLPTVLPIYKHVSDVSAS